MKESPIREDHSLALLERGMVLRERMLPSHNCTYVVELGDSAAGRMLAVYKPRDGEAPLWDFPDHTLYRREYLSYRVSESLDWGVVPVTVIREGPYGIGTMQRFVQARPQLHYFNLLPQHREEMARIAVFDCLVNNTDRKSGHCLKDPDGRIWAIDHGLTFSVPPKLRTVMWDLCDEAVPEETRTQVEALPQDASLRESLAEHLTRREVEAFYRRVQLIASADIIPLRMLSDPHRPIPWPAI